MRRAKNLILLSSVCSTQACNVSVRGSCRKDTDADSLRVCAQQSLHFLLHVRRFNVLQDREKEEEIRLHVALAARHTEAAAGCMPGSTLAIKNRRGPINMAQLRINMKIYSQDKVEV